MPKITKILIVEDEMIIAANVALQLKNLGYEITGLLPRVDEVLPSIIQNTPDIILLDINLNAEIDGIELAHIIQKTHSIPIIFLTANADEDHFKRAKVTNPYAFLSKPFKKIDLQRAVELAVIRIEQEKTKNIEDTVAEHSSILPNCIFVRSHDKMVKVCIDDIFYIEAERNYCKIFCREKEHLIVSTLKELDEKLVAKNLMRIHRSFIINLNHIDEIATSHVVIGKKVIPISSELKKELLQHIQKV